jgi:hypothetical protein
MLGEPAEVGRESAEASESTEAPPTKRLRRRRLRKKVIKDESHKWEAARHDAGYGSCSLTAQGVSPRKSA